MFPSLPFGAVASALEEGFGRYMEPLKPFMANTFNHSTDPGICSITIGLISDIVCALNEDEALLP